MTWEPSLFHNSTVNKILISENPSSDAPVIASGVEYSGQNGERNGFLQSGGHLGPGVHCTPGYFSILMLPVSWETLPASPSWRNFGANTAALVFGKFGKVLNNWVMHPLSGQMEEFSQKEKGGYLLEGSEVMEGPLSFAEVMVDEEGIPLWGKKQKEIMENYRYYAGIFINIHDVNDGRIFRGSLRLAQKKSTSR